jgi:protein-L-isoaspartate(D-aspartate) O-methyltransferase
MTTVRDSGVEDASSLRAAMVGELRRDEAITSDAVAAAFSTVPRHVFAVGEPLEAVYEANRALEVGSGGYNAALLQELVGLGWKVVSVDIDPQIAERAPRLPVGCRVRAGRDGAGRRRERHAR